MHRLAHENPSHVRPPFAIDWGMRIAFVIGVAMMNAMRGDPEDWSAFEGERGANRQEIFNPLGSPVSAMRQQAVIAHADAEASRDPPEKDQCEKSFPTEEEKCGDGSDVKQEHERGGNPVDFVLGGGLALERFQLHLISPWTIC